MRHLLIRPLDEEAQVVVVLWMWGVQVLRVIIYVLYHSAHLLIWKSEKKKLLSHYDFREQFVRAWLESDSGNESQRK